MPLELIPVSIHQLNEVTSLAITIWNAHYPAIIGQQQVDYMLHTMYSYEALVKQRNEKGHVFYFIQSEGHPIGFISVEYNTSLKEVFLHKFYLLSKKQNLGIGTKAFHLLLETFPTANTFRLTVNRKNFKSINFYFKNGFTIESIKDLDIGHGYFMNDFIMVKKLSCYFL